MGASVLGLVGDATAAAATTSGGQSVNVDAIANMVDPALVDITSTDRYTGEQAAGTGMIITSNGDVLTNNHVVEGATSITVRLADSTKTYKATVVGVDPSADVAVIHLDGASHLPTVKIANSSSVKVGDTVVAIGNAEDKPGKPSVSSGSVVALQQNILASDLGATSENLYGLIEINAPLEPGDSGGPLLNAKGQVIGMDTAAQTPSGPQTMTSATSSTVGYAIPIDEAMSIAHQMEAGHGTSTIHIGTTAFLGVEVSPSGTSSPFSSGSSTTSGALVEGVEPNSPAAKAGLAPGDEITSLGGRTVTSASSLQRAIDAYHPGNRVKVTWVDQNGSTHTATVTLAQGPTA
jgi:S1-C subfamily serine protease